MPDLNTLSLNGVTSGGDRRPYFAGPDTFGNPTYEWYSSQSDDTADDFEAAEIANIYDWNKSQYNNWYNSPALVLSRFQEAGLNPLYFFGNGSGITPAQGAAGANAPNVKHANNKMLNILTAAGLVSDSLLNTQKQALDYDIARRLQDIDLRRVGLEDRLTAVMEKQLGINAEKTKQDIEESRSRVALNGATIEQIGKQNNWTDQLIAESKAREAVLKKEVDQVVANAENLRAQAGYYNISASRIRQMIPLEIENLAAMTNLSYWLASVEVEKMYNFSMDTSKKQVEIDVGRQLKILIERQADGLLKTNLILASDAAWRGDLHQMEVATGYWQAVNGSINAVGSAVGAASSFYGPKATFYKGAALKGLFNNNTTINPFNNYHSDWPSNLAVWTDSTPIVP